MVFRPLLYYCAEMQGAWILGEKNDKCNGFTCRGLAETAYSEAGMAATGHPLFLHFDTCKNS